MPVKTGVRRSSKSRRAPGDPRRRPSMTTIVQRVPVCSSARRQVCLSVFSRRPVAAAPARIEAMLRAKSRIR